MRYKSLRRLAPINETSQFKHLVKIANALNVPIATILEATPNVTQHIKGNNNFQLNVSIVAEPKTKHQILREINEPLEVQLRDKEHIIESLETTHTSELHSFMEQKLKDKGKTLEQFADWIGVSLDDFTGHISNDNEAFNKETNDKGRFNVIHNHTQKITGDHNSQNIGAIMNEAALAYFDRVDQLKNEGY